MKAPKKIYLQVVDNEIELYAKTTWAQDRINDRDIEYVWADAIRDLGEAAVVPPVMRRCDKHCRFYGYEYDGQLDHICRVKSERPMIIPETTYAKSCPDFKKRNGV